MAEMGSKLNVFKDPYLDLASETDDLMAKMRSINGGAVGTDTGLSGRRDMLKDLNQMNDELKVKAERLNNLQKKHDDLDARR